MSSIRRLLSGVSNAVLRATRFEVGAPIRRGPPPPVEPVRRGFSDHSDFQSALEAERSPLSAHAPKLAGRPGPAPDALRHYSGLSDFQAALPRYQHLLGAPAAPPAARGPEGLAAPASAQGASLPALSEAPEGGFFPSLEDLPASVEPEPAPESTADFMPSLEDLPGDQAPPAPRAAGEEALFTPTGALAEGQAPLEVAERVALQGPPEAQARLATALYEQGQAPGLADSSAYQRGAALAASGSPEATQALLDHVGEARLEGFTRALLQA